MTVLTTPRLVLRPPTAEDTERWHAVVWGDPEVAHWLPPHAPITVDRLERFITERALLHWDEHGFGIWLLEDDSRRLVGHCGLVVNEPGRVDLTEEDCGFEGGFARPRRQHAHFVGAVMPTARSKLRDARRWRSRHRAHLLRPR